MSEEEKKKEVEKTETEPVTTEDESKPLTRSYFVVIAGILTLLCFFMALTFSKVLPPLPNSGTGVWGDLVKLVEVLLKLF